MTNTKIGERTVNLDNFAWAENAQIQHNDPAGRSYIPAVKVHFTGGACLILYGQDAATAREQFGLGRTNGK